MQHRTLAIAMEDLDTMLVVKELPAAYDVDRFVYFLVTPDEVPHPILSSVYWVIQEWNQDEAKVNAMLNRLTQFVCHEEVSNE